MSVGYLSTVRGRAQRPLASPPAAIRRVVAGTAYPATPQAPHTAPLRAPRSSPGVERVVESPRTPSATVVAPPISPAAPPASKREAQPVAIMLPKQAASAVAAPSKQRSVHPASPSPPSPPLPAAPEVRTTVIREPAPPPAREVELHTVQEGSPAVMPAASAPPVIHETPSSPPEPRAYRVRWPDAAPPVSAPVRERVEREVIRAARTEWRKHAERAAAPAAAPPVIDIHVDQVTVKIEAPPQPPLAAEPPSQAPRAGDRDGGFSSYFLKRSIAGF